MAKMFRQMELFMEDFFEIPAIICQYFSLFQPIFFYAYVFSLLIFCLAYENG
jgi:hypothetical protein